MQRQSFSTILERVRDFAAGMGLILIDSKTLNPYFKGDLDGTRVWINFDMDDEEELFNVLHMLGHSVQWGMNEAMKALGSKLHKNPDPETLVRLQEYEWEANCYGLGILHALGIFYLDEWLYAKYSDDMFLLTHFYRTGEKLKNITMVSKESWMSACLAVKPLVAKIVPPTFIPTQIEGSRDGLVIDFSSQTT